MQDFWSKMNGFDLSARNRQELDEIGFTIIPGPVPAHDLAQLVVTYDAAVNNAITDDVKVGSSTTRVRDFVNRGPEFDKLYLHPPVLKACCHIIGKPFRLSTMHARTLRPGLPAQDLHADYERDSHGWTMVGFIFMIDEFRNDNGATRFVPGSHLRSDLPQSLFGDRDRKADYPTQVLACGPAGSMVLFNGSIWHGHTVNHSNESRRSIQGAYIRRDAESGENLLARMQPETLSRISPLAKYVLALPSSTEPKESLLAKATSSENGEKIRVTLVESARQLD
jgi:ectoine hydroxylase-related dioxygenase (phytanoyl-CoA dioxygenase family)